MWVSGTKVLLCYKRIPAEYYLYPFKAAKNIYILLLRLAAKLCATAGTQAAELSSVEQLTAAGLSVALGSESLIPRLFVLNHMVNSRGIIWPRIITTK